MSSIFFKSSIQESDSTVAKSIDHEFKRQQNTVELIASENIVSRAVLEGCGSVLTNKYAEGYPSRRYYGGCEHVDEIENLAIERAKQLFDCEYVNVQPHSGSTANQAVIGAFVNPGDTILGMSLDCGGHLTHGHRMTMCGKWFNIVSYGVDKETYLINWKSIEELAQKHKPKLIIAGFSAYSRNINWAKFREIADSVGAILMIDMAHIAGLVAGGVCPSPIPYADVVTTTTHKTLRGSRGAMILAKTLEHAKKLNSSVFPGFQGGPLMHQIDLKAVALGEALKPEFKVYATQVVRNAKRMGDVLIGEGIDILTGGTDNHMILLDLRKTGITGKVASDLLESVNIACNKNTIPFDPEPPMIASGLRIGTPSITTRGFGEEECGLIASLMATIIKDPKNETNMISVKSEVKCICDRFPIY